MAVFAPLLDVHVAYTVLRTVEKCYSGPYCFEKASGVAQSVLCLTTDWTSGVRSPAEANDFSSSLCVQTSSEAHPPSYTMGTGGPSPGSKAWPGRGADHSPI
jgi:hypothetical protein